VRAFLKQKVMKEEVKEELVRLIDWYVNTSTEVTGLFRVHGAEKVVENYINSLKPKLEVGKWYKDEDGSIAFYQGDNVETYGINELGQWISDGSWFYYWNLEVYEWTQVTDKEVEKALKAEAKRRGFKKCVNFNTAWANEERYADIGHFKYIAANNCLYLDGNTVFYEGRWAEIIKEPKEVTLEEIAEKFGVPVHQLKIKK
jgi:hypothetical protein